MALPLFTLTKTVSITAEAVLLTEGFNKDSVNKFLGANNNNIPVITLDKNVQAAGNYPAHYLAGIRFFSQQYPDITTVHIFGYGAEKNELDLLKNVSVIFHPTEIPSGITSIHWPQKIRTGERLLIQGSCNISSSKATIVLNGFNSTLDSINLSGGKNQSFQLTTIPKHSGRAVYSITVIAKKDTLESEVIPVQVEQGEPVKVLMLSSSPNFDSKFLKNSLSQNGYKVVVRTAISKNKFSKEFLNVAAMPVDQVSASLLDKIDITIADATELASISKPELVTIQSQVSQKSMGLIIRADSAFSNSSFYSARFSLSPVANYNRQPIDMYLLDSTGKLPVTTAEDLFFIRNRPATQPIVSDKQNRMYVNSTLYGSGKIIVTTLTSTYSWALSGNEEMYEKFWATLLNKGAPQSLAEESWSISPGLPKINEPVQLALQTNNTSIPVGEVNGAAIYLKADDDLPYRWSGTYYAAKAGWQTGIQLNGNPFYFYAYNKGNWKSLYALQKIEVTQQYIKRNFSKFKNRPPKLITTDNSFLRIVLFILFIISCAFLWVESKL